MDTPPDATASLVAGHSDNAFVVANALAPAPASTQTTAPPTPHHRGHTPPPATPPALDAAVHAFAARANSSDRRAQSSPDQRSASNRAAASRTLSNNSDNRATTLLRTAEPERKVVEPDPEAHHEPTEHPFGVQDRVSLRRSPVAVNLRLTTSPRQRRVDAWPLLPIPFP